MALVDGRWYALQVIPTYESVTRKWLEQSGYTVYLPTITVKRQWSDRMKVTTKAMFPGYAFCQYDAALRGRMVDSPRVVRIVGVGRLPMPIDDTELDSVRILENSGFAVETWRHLSEGDKVRVCRGPLKGLEGYFVRQRARSRIAVQLTLLGQSVIADLDGDAVDSISPVRKPQARTVGTPATGHLAAVSTESRFGPNSSGLSQSLVTSQPA